MPKEKFWGLQHVDNDEPDFEVRWGDAQPSVTVNGLTFDRSGLNRLIRTLRRGRDATYGPDE